MSKCKRKKIARVQFFQAEAAAAATAARKRAKAERDAAAKRLKRRLAKLPQIFDQTEQAA